MTSSLNELLRQAQRPDHGDPGEVLMARQLRQQAKALADEGARALQRFEYLEDKETHSEAEQVFDGITLQASRDVDRV